MRLMWSLACQQMQWVRVLTYHSISDGDSPLTVSLTEFDKHMQWVKAHFTPIRLSQLLSYRECGNALPSNPILITFDDGYQDNLMHAFPVLCKHEIPSMIFVATGFVGGNMPLFAKMLPTLSWSEVREIHASGLVEFGAHTRTHQRLSEVSPQVAWRTIVDSKSDLENKLSVAIDAFCYPQNCYNATVVGLVQRAGFRAAFGGTGFVHRFSPRYRLRRIQMERDLTFAQFKSALAYNSTGLRDMMGDVIFQLRYARWRVANLSSSSTAG